MVKVWSESARNTMTLKARFTYLVLAFVSLMLIGCASVPKGSATLQRQAELMVPPEGTAGVYVFRPSLYGSGALLLWKAEMNSELFGYLAPRSYLYGIVPSGKYTVGGEGTRVVPFNARAGNNYYFKLSFSSGLVRIEADEARQLMHEFTLSKYNIFESIQLTGFSANSTQSINSDSGTVSRHGEQECHKESSVLCPTNTNWDKKGKFTLSIWLEESDKNRVTFTFWFNDRNEIKIATPEGDIIMLSGKVMLTKGLKLQPGYEIDAADGPVLFYKLAMTLLARAYPNGPEDIVNSRKIHISEQTIAISLTIGSAYLNIAAPWEATAQASRNEKNAVLYKIAFGSVDTSGTLQTRHLSGSWEDDRSGLILDDAMDITQWQTYIVGPQLHRPESNRQKQDGSRVLGIFDYGASPKEFNAKTIGELRSFIKQQK